MNRNGNKVTWIRETSQYLYQKYVLINYFAATYWLGIIDVDILNIISKCNKDKLCDVENVEASFSIFRFVHNYCIYIPPKIEFLGGEQNVVIAQLQMFYVI